MVPEMVLPSSVQLQASRLPEAEAPLLADDSDWRSMSLGENSTSRHTYLATNQTIRSEENLSIDETLEGLIKEDGFSADSSSPDILAAQRGLVFAMLGWQSMLFLTAYDTKGSSNLKIYRAPRESNSGLVLDNWTVPIELSDSLLAILLKAFGNLLLARSGSSENVASETSKQAFSRTSLSSSDVNAYLLHILL
jgi:hypothetical protein